MDILHSSTKETDNSSALHETASISSTSNSLSTKLKAIHKAQNTLPKLIDNFGDERTLDKFYVNLQISKYADHKRYDDEKKPISYNQILNAIDNDNPEVTKALITGVPGIGKSTLMQYLAWQWGNGNLWNDKFEFVFKIKLKSIASAKWERQLEDNEENPLPTLLLLALREQFNQLLVETQNNFEKITLAEISTIINSSKDKILFLLDGYDEIAHKTQDSDNIAHIIIREILKFPNVIMTSRPYIQNTEFVKYSPRLIENIGLNEKSIDKYIENYFHNTQLDIHNKEIDSEHLEYAKSRLTNLLHSNPSVMEACKIPVNISLMCLISNDTDVNSKFKEEFTITSLYSEVLVWLGKRYLNKFAKENRESYDVSQITTKQIYGIDEVKCLSTIAYEAFNSDYSDKNCINNKKIEDVINKAYEQNQTNVVCERGEVKRVFDNEFKDRLFQFGLFKNPAKSKVTNNGDNKIANEADKSNINDKEQRIEFIHETFQEFLAAVYLKNQFNANEAETAALFIGTNRNNPLYLTTFKFLSGLISSHNLDAGNKSKVDQAELLVRRFWESVTCNVDGILEFGLDAKINLLMHLLEEAKRNGSLDDRIPNLGIIEQLIDIEVLNDIPKWSDTLIASKYMSHNIADVLKSIVTEHNNNSKAITTKAEEMLRSEKIDPKLLTQLQSLITKKSTQEQPLEIVQATQILNSDNDILGQVIEVVVNLTYKKEFRWGKYNGSEVAKEEIFKVLLNLLKTQKDWQIQRLCLQKLIEITDETISTKLLLEAVEIILNQERPLIADNNLKTVSSNLALDITKLEPKLAGEVFTLLLPLLDSDNRDIKFAAAQTLIVALVQAEPELAPK